MQIGANAPKGKDLRDNCRSLSLKAQSEEEEKWLTSVYMHIVHGGPQPGQAPTWHEDDEK